MARNPAGLMMVLLSLLTLWGCSDRGRETKLWSNLCTGCHDGRTAPTAGRIREKYRSIGEFSVAVGSRGHRCMEILKNDDALIRKVGLEIGLRDRQ